MRIKTLFCILALFAFALIFAASPPETGETAAAPSTFDLVVTPNVSVTATHLKCQAQKCSTLETSSLKVQHTGMVMAVQERSRFDFKPVALLVPEGTFARFDKPPSWDPLAVMETDQVLRL